MAKSSDELERELDLKRQQLHARTNKLRTRVADNVRGVRNQTQEEIASYRHKAESQVSDHPWLALAGGFGGGIALGIAKGGGSSHKPSHSDAGSDDHGESLLSRGVGALFSATGGPVLNEVRDTLQDTLSELKGTLEESVSDVVHGITGTSGGHTNGAVEHRQRVRDHVAA
jgi:ElaB/YqjD/DUF883 family membrane-anchored ribosome-binding protein